MTHTCALSLVCQWLIHSLLIIFYGWWCRREEENNSSLGMLQRVSDPSALPFDVPFLNGEKNEWNSPFGDAFRSLVALSSLMGKRWRVPHHLGIHLGRKPCRMTPLALMQKGNSLQRDAFRQLVDSRYIMMSSFDCEGEEEKARTHLGCF